MTIAAVLAALFAVWRFIRLRSRFRDLRQGEEGERAVGQFLERLRETGYQVFHDVIGFNANIDHVLIGSAGIFTIETKTWSKPLRGDARVPFDGERVWVGGHEPDRNPVVQARATGSIGSSRNLPFAGSTFSRRTIPSRIGPTADKTMHSPLWVPLTETVPARDFE